MNLYNLSRKYQKICEMSIIYFECLQINDAVWSEIFMFNYLFKLYVDSKKYV